MYRGGRGKGRGVWRWEKENMLRKKEKVRKYRNGRRRKKIKKGRRMERESKEQGMIVES